MRKVEPTAEQAAWAIEFIVADLCRLVSKQLHKVHHGLWEETAKKASNIRLLDLAKQHEGGHIGAVAATGLVSEVTRRGNAAHLTLFLYGQGYEMQTSHDGRLLRLAKVDTGNKPAAP